MEFQPETDSYLLNDQDQHNLGIDSSVVPATELGTIMDSVSALQDQLTDINLQLISCRPGAERNQLRVEQVAKERYLHGVRRLLSQSVELSDGDIEQLLRG